MAYTGTGTEADPYLVSTFADFITCAGTDGAYVKVTSDIDISQEETYQYGITSVVYIRATKIYADNVKKLENLKVTAQTLFSFSDIHDTSIEKIYFKNWIHKKTQAGSPTLDSYKCTFTDCCFSIEMICGVYGCETIGCRSDYGNFSQFVKCAFNVKYMSTGTDGYTYNAGNLIYRSILDRCTFEYSGLDRPASCPPIIGVSAKMQYCTIIGENSVYLPAAESIAANLIYHSGDWWYTISNCVFAVAFAKTSDSASGSTITISLSNNDNYISDIIADSDILGDGISYNFSSKATALTTAQIKSKEYLESIGFLP